MLATLEKLRYMTQSTVLHPVLELLLFTSSCCVREKSPRETDKERMFVTGTFTFPSLKQHAEPQSAAKNGKLPNRIDNENTGGKKT